MTLETRFYNANMGNSPLIFTKETRTPQTFDFGTYLIEDMELKRGSVGNDSVDGLLERKSIRKGLNPSTYVESEFNTCDVRCKKAVHKYQPTTGAITKIVCDSLTPEDYAANNFQNKFKGTYIRRQLASGDILELALKESDKGTEILRLDLPKEMSLADLSKQLKKLDALAQKVIRKALKSIV